MNSDFQTEREIQLGDEIQHLDQNELMGISGGQDDLLDKFWEGVGSAAGEAAEILQAIGAKADTQTIAPVGGMHG